MARSLTSLGVGVLFLILSGGCEPAPEVAPPAGIEGSESFEHVTVAPMEPAHERRLLDPTVPRTPTGDSGDPAEGPCSCETDDCLQDWADANLGCDICVSVVCDGEPGPHVCHACSPDDPF